MLFGTIILVLFFILFCIVVFCTDCIEFHTFHESIKRLHQPKERN